MKLTCHCHKRINLRQTKIKTIPIFSARVTEYISPAEIRTFREICALLDFIAADQFQHRSY